MTDVGIGMTNAKLIFSRNLTQVPYLYFSILLTFFIWYYGNTIILLHSKIKKMENVIIFVVLLVLLYIPTHNCEYENWGTYRKTHFSIVLLMFVLFFLKFFFID